MDLTDWIKERDLLERMPASSFSPWTTRGRIFGLPHDVHPVLLAVRADLLDQYNIDVSGIETWADFRRVMLPIKTDENGDGEPDRYPIAFWPSRPELLEPLMLQGGTGYFDEDGRPVVNSEENTVVLATVVSWCVGPDRIAADIQDFSAAGNQLKASGYAVAYLTPDWMCNVWKNELPQMSGKLEIIPLPAWREGGRHASVRGGTMMAIPKDTIDKEAALAFAERLYLSPRLARELYTRGDIVTPLKEYWDEDFFNEPDPYFNNKPKGRLYIEHMDHVPPRHPSPLAQDTAFRVSSAGMKLLRYAQDNQLYSPEELLPEAQRLMGDVQAEVQRQLDRNVFLSAGES